MGWENNMHIVCIHIYYSSIILRPLQSELQKFPTWGLECTCSCFVPGLSCSYLCSHASPPRSSLWYRERCFLSPLLWLFRQPRGKAFPLATAVYAAVKVFLWLLQLFSAAPSFTVRNWALLWVCLQLQEIHEKWSVPVLFADFLNHSRGEEFGLTARATETFLLKH